MADTQVMLSSFSFSPNLSPQSQFSSQTLDLLYAKYVGKALLESGVRKVDLFNLCFGVIGRGGGTGIENRCVKPTFMFCGFGALYI